MIYFDRNKNETVHIPIIEQGIIRNVFNSDDTYIKSGLPFILNSIKLLNLWGMEYHSSQIISHSRFEFLRTLYQKQSVI